MKARPAESLLPAGPR